MRFKVVFKNSYNMIKKKISEHILVIFIIFRIILKNSNKILQIKII